MERSYRQIFYKGLAETTKKRANEHPEQNNKVLLDLEKVYRLLADLNDDELYRLFDSGAFNDIVKAYCETAAKKTGLNYEQTAALLEELKILFDFKGAKDILKAAGYAVNE